LTRNDHAQCSFRRKRRARQALRSLRGDRPALRSVSETRAFYVPLEQLQLAAPTELYLGLVHVKDGVSGSMARAAAAKRHTRDFGIASECGISRGRDPNLALDFIDVYAKTAAAL
jgi:hypothetical protein